jgi:amino acid adenylation domain-containing protein
MYTEDITQDVILVASQNLKERAYWLEQLAGKLKWTHFLYDFNPGKNTRAPERENIIFQLSQDIYDPLMEKTKGNAYTLHLILWAALVVLVNKYSDIDDIIIETPIYKQEEEGTFINSVLPLRIPIKEDMTFTRLLLRSRETLFEAIRHQNYPLRFLNQRLEIPAADKENSSISDVALLLENIQPGEYLEKSNYNIIFSFLETGNAIRGNLEFNRSVYRPVTVEKISEYFTRILHQLLSDCEAPLAHTRMLTDREKQQVLFDFNATESAFPRGKQVHQWFEERVQKLPGNIAVVFRDKAFTYKQLNARANQLAQQLNNRGAAAGAIVSLVVEPSLEMLVGILGILKAGAAYLPIDPTYPVTRIAFMLADSGSRWILSHASLVNNIEFAGEVIALEDQNLYSSSPTNPGRIGHPGELIYVIYTSGSTGKPKGVLVENESVFNILFALEQAYPMGENDAYLLKTNYTFDVSVTELLGWFFGRGRLVIPEPGGNNDPETIISILPRCRVTHINFVPSILNVFLEALGERAKQAFKPLKYIFVAGEMFSPQLLQKIKSLRVSTPIENLYGPTEATIYATGYSLSTDDTVVLIGKPLNNIIVYILDKTGHPQPPCIPGELCIGGAGTARGYLNNPGLTAQKFIFISPGLYRSYLSYRTNILYKTGDLARWLPDGNIEFLGRIDQQVKIRGFRIEPGEIETALKNHEAIKEAVVIDREEQDGSRSLCAYFTASRELTVSGLNHYLVTRLPDYMIPAYFIRVEQIPVTPSGKIDRQALPKPDSIIDTGEEYIAPQSDKERQMADIWKKILQLEKVGVNDNFFHLGGSSSRAILLGSELKKKMNIDVPVVDIFEHLTIRSLLRSLEQKESGTGVSQGIIDYSREIDKTRLSRAKQRNRRKK